MNKNKLIITISCFVLIGFVAAVSVGQRKEKSHTEYITIIKSADSPTAAADIVRTTTKVRRTTTSATTVTTVSETNPAVTEPLWININTAGHDELIRLPHIGDVLADNLIAYRQVNGDFRNIEEIMLVDGIGDGIFSDICGYIYVDNPVYEENVTEAATEISYEPEDEPIEPPLEEITEPDMITLEDVIPIDLNTADAETLMLLPYVTEEAAVKIIELREEIRYFSHPYEIYYAEVLEPHQIEEIMEYVTVVPKNPNENQINDKEQLT